MKSSPFIILTVLLMTIALQVQSLKAEETTSLESKKWVVEQIGTYKGNLLGFIKFDNGNLEGQSTCNLYSAVYDLKPDQKITIHRIGIGQLLCNINNKMELESNFIEGLENAENYVIKEGKLILYKADKTEIARFK